ncbi:MAG: DUF2029 domain-containing protein [Deltaproteobacteria bacterium]|nr:MAG: DUF2029 domain-containing protein [Deltaproteobacteria bacterium]
MLAKLENPLLLLIATLAIGWHLAAVQSTWETSGKGRPLRDFASYYYADAALDAGKDPYVARNIRAEARKDLVSGTVHPFFYPPPFLLLTDGLSAFDARTAWQLWFWLDELAVLAVALALGWWWRRLGLRVTVLVALSLATLTAIDNNHLMGQANLPVLALVVAALWADSVGRTEVAGISMGTAAMLKMSPALFVVWWLLRGRTSSALWAAGTAVALSVATLLVMPWQMQLRFYTEVLPTFGTGEYNGLTVGIGLFGNHSIPDLYNTAFPGNQRVLSSPAQTLATITAAFVPALTLWRLRDEPADAWAAAGQVGALCVTILLIPVYTYEHHVVFAIPAAVAAGGAALHGRLHRGWILPLVLAWAAWSAPLTEVKHFALGLGNEWAALLLRETKFAALLVFYAACLWLGSALHIPAKRT